MTMAEYIDHSLNEFSICESGDKRKEWTIMVNNTLYVGSERPKGKSSFGVADNIVDISVFKMRQRRNKTSGNYLTIMDLMCNRERLEMSTIQVSI